MASASDATAVVANLPSGVHQIDSLLWGYRWQDSFLTYSFPQHGSYFSTNSTTGYGSNTGIAEPWVTFFDPLSTSDTIHFRDALQTFSNVANIKFSEVSDNSTTVGTIRAAYSYLSEKDNSTAWTYLPALTPKAGDIWFNAVGTAGLNYWAEGSFSYLSVIHELGHALGLKHPFEGTTTLDATQDSRSFTIMSYSAYQGDTATHFSYEPTTPMLFDIAALQYMYGANDTYNADNTTYTYYDTGAFGLVLFRYHETIWDAGGTDTIEYAGELNSTIDLRPGAGSTIGEPIYVDSSTGVHLQRVKNIWIAAGTVIENATGGSGADTIYGNDVANNLDGGSGNDEMFGFDGNDRFDWDSSRRNGADTMHGGAGDDTYVVNSLADVIVEDAGEGTDVVWADITYSLSNIANVENLSLFGTAAIGGTGNNLANVIRGNSATNIISGGLGNDTLLGDEGRDFIDGGDGFDLSTYADSSGDVIASLTSSAAVDWSISDGSWVQADASETLTSIEALEGGAGSDLLYGDANSNALFGNDGQDYLYGFGGNDRLLGGAGIDYVQGGSGNDTLAGGAGNDVLIGGYGADQFVFDAALDAANNLDTIKDFASGSDKIMLENAIFTALTATGSLDSNFFRAGVGVTTAADGNDYLIYDNSTGSLYYDQDGTGAAAPTQFATLAGNPAITAGDFLIT